MTSIQFKIQDPKYGFLSNFYYSSFIDDSGVVWKTNEHFYQAMKTTNVRERGDVWACRTPKEAKRVGSKVALRDDWNVVKELVMMEGLVYKFEQNVDLRTRLLDTVGIELIEWAPWDNYWGSGKDGNGRNRLGKLLMALRDDLYKTEHFITV